MFVAKSPADDYAVIVLISDSEWSASVFGSAQVGLRVGIVALLHEYRSAFYVIAVSTTAVDRTIDDCASHGTLVVSESWYGTAHSKACLFCVHVFSARVCSYGLPSLCNKGFMCRDTLSGVVDATVVFVSIGFPVK